MDRYNRLMYSTDASIYQMVPVGVAVPRDAADVEAVIRTAREFGVPVIFDATHAVQQPGEEETGGERHLAATLMRSAAAVGVDGFFAETHPDPDAALSDGATSIPLAEMHDLLEGAKEIHDLVGASSANPGHRSRR